MMGTELVNAQDADNSTTSEWALRDLNPRPPACKAVEVPQGPPASTNSECNQSQAVERITKRHCRSRAASLQWGPTGGNGTAQGTASSDDTGAWRLARPYPALPERGVYIVHARGTGRYKIGHSSNLHKRLRLLAIGCPVLLRLVALLPDKGLETEAELHVRFARTRLHGEWFGESVELLDFIREHWFDRPAICE